MADEVHDSRIPSEDSAWSRSVVINWGKGTHVVIKPSIIRAIGYLSTWGMASKRYSQVRISFDMDRGEIHAWYGDGVANHFFMLGVPSVDDRGEPTFSFHS